MHSSESFSAHTAEAAGKAGDTPNSVGIGHVFNGLVPVALTSGASGGATERVLHEVQRVARLRPHSVVLMNRRARATDEPPADQSLAERALRTSRLNNLIRSSEYNGRMSPHARRQFKDAIETTLTAIVTHFPKLQYHSKGYNQAWVYPTFVTLTLPSKQCHDDRTLREECLKPFMEWLTGRTVTDKKTGKVYTYEGMNVRAYFWVAETQKNGNVHFHLVIDRAVDWLLLRKKWNECLQRLDYVDAYEAKQRAFFRQFDGTYSFRYNEGAGKQQIKAKLDTWRKKGQKITPDVRRAARQQEVNRQQKAFENALRDGFRNPNSTDIHKIRSLRSITAYVTKYMTKGTTPEWVIKSTGKRVPFEQESQIQTWYELDGERFGKQREATEYQLRHGLTEKPTKRSYLVTRMQEMTDGIRHYVDHEQPVVRRYPGRRLDGRVWGYSRCLRQAKATGSLKPFELLVSTFQEFVPVVTKTRTRHEPIQRTDLFGNKVFSHYHEVRVDYQIEGEPVRRNLINPVASAYLDRLREKIPPEVIQEASRMIVGRDDIEIIPCREAPQHELLPQIAPKVFEQYQLHHVAVFTRIWGETVPADAA